MLEKVRFLPSTKECSKVEIVLVLVPALSYQAYQSAARTASNARAFEFSAVLNGGRHFAPQNG